MAFYNFGLRLLRHVHEAERAGTPFMSVEARRATGSPASWASGTRIDAGTLRVGDRADLVVIDPERLDASLEEYRGHRSTVRRPVPHGQPNDAAVPAVFVAAAAWSPTASRPICSAGADRAVPAGRNRPACRTCCSDGDRGCRRLTRPARVNAGCGARGPSRRRP